MKKTKEEILKILKDKQIEQKPRWHFQLQKILIWTAVIGGLIISGLLSSVLIQFSLAAGVKEVIGPNFPAIIMAFRLVPSLFILIIMVAVLINSILNKLTPKGYRVTYLKSLFITLAVVGLLGSLFFGLGVGPRMHQQFLHIKPYKAEFDRRHRLPKEEIKGVRYYPPAARTNR